MGRISSYGNRFNPEVEAFERPGPLYKARHEDIQRCTQEMPVADGIAQPDRRTALARLITNPPAPPTCRQFMSRRATLAVLPRAVRPDLLPRLDDGLRCAQAAVCAAGTRAAGVRVAPPAAPPAGPARVARTRGSGRRPSSRAGTAGMGISHRLPAVFRPMTKARGHVKTEATPCARASGLAGAEQRRPP